eukprot:2254151-Pleurochrysis_carterae.AAC.1
MPPDTMAYTGEDDADLPGDETNNPEQEKPDAADEEGTIAEILQRRKRMPAAVVASDLLAEP